MSHLPLTLSVLSGALGSPGPARMNVCGLYVPRPPPPLPGLAQLQCSCCFVDSSPTPDLPSPALVTVVREESPLSAATAPLGLLEPQRWYRSSGSPSLAPGGGAVLPAAASAGHSHPSPQWFGGLRETARPHVAALPTDRSLWLYPTPPPSLVPPLAVAFLGASLAGDTLLLFWNVRLLSYGLASET